MDVRQLRYFVRIVELGSLTRASETLHVAQPALGLQIRKLEEELDVQLLARHSRGVTATQAGVILLEEAKSILSQVELAADRVRNVNSSQSGRVVVGTTPSVNALMASTLAHQCATSLPNVSLTLIEELSAVLLEWVHIGRVDIGFVHRIDCSKELSTDPLATEELYFVSAPGYCSSLSSKVPLADVADYPLILPSANHALRELIEEKAAERDIQLHIPFEVHSSSTICELVAEGTACTILPYGLVKSLVKQRKLVATPIVDPRMMRTLFLVTSEKRSITCAQSAVHELIRRLIQREVSCSQGAWKPSPAT